ncbi:hypothetical protein Lal_00013638 [Lupinus albus]|nr:hypothetical protein Lal_00013638 [Lupinus albus]
MAATTTNTGTLPSSPPFSPSAASPLQAVSSPLVLPFLCNRLTREITIKFILHILSCSLFSLPVCTFTWYHAMAATTTNTGTLPSSPPFSPSAASPLQAVSSPLVLPLPSMKLIEKNYLVWRHFMISTLTSNRANRFVLGNDIPHHFLNDDDRLINHVNPAYLRWEELDQSVFSWILNSLSESLQPHVVGCVHSSSCGRNLTRFATPKPKHETDSYVLSFVLSRKVLVQFLISKYLNKVEYEHNVKLVYALSAFQA